MSAFPLFATPRTPSRLTVGGEVAAIAQSLGTPFMPWQRQLADVANEIRADGQGFAYPVVVALIPRQAGKSLVALTHLIHRAQSFDRGFCWYTSNTQAAATQMFRDQWLPLLEDSGISHTPRLSNGSENVTFPSKGKVGLFPPSRNGLHGKQSDLVIVDELWKFSAEQGKDIMAGIGPTMATRPWRQQWLISAGADAHSGWLLELRERCRKLAGDTTSGVCFVEFHPAVDAYGAVVDDLADPATWAKVHPAVGHTIDLEFLIAQRVTDGEANFNRAYLNVADLAPELAAGTLFELDAWNACADPANELDDTSGLFISYDVSPARTKASVALTRRNDDGTITAELVDHGDGVAWVAPRVAELAAKYSARIVADSKGACTTVTAALRDEHVKVTELTHRDVCNAVGELLDDVSHGRLTHRGQHVLDESVAAVVPRPQTDGSVLYSRRTSRADITAIAAVTWSAFGARHMPPLQEPFIMFAG